MDNLLSGLIGVLAGSAISSLALLWLNDADAKRVARGGGRAVYYELAINAAICRNAFPVRGITITRTAWDDYQGRLALYLPPAVFKATAKPYLKSPLLEVLLQNRTTDATVTSNVAEGLEAAATEFLKARGLLQPYVWSEKELATLKPDTETE